MDGTMDAGAGTLYRSADRATMASPNLSDSEQIFQSGSPPDTQLHFLALERGSQHGMNG